VKEIESELPTGSLSFIAFEFESSIDLVLPLCDIGLRWKSKRIMTITQFRKTPKEFQRPNSGFSKPT
jgi:hypothetical protein